MNTTGKMAPYDAYCMYVAMKLHFTKKDYDFITYRGSVKIKQETFDRLAYKSMFYKLVNLYPPERLKTLFLIVLARNPKAWPGDFLTTKSAELLRSKEMFDSAQTYQFESELDTILDSVNSVEELISMKNGNLPFLYVLLNNDEVRLDTFIIIDDILSLTSKWKIEKINPFWSSQKLQLDKYAPFVKYDKSKCKKILVSKLKQKSEKQKVGKNV